MSKMSKIGFLKGSIKWSKVREKSGNFEVDIDWQLCECINPGLVSSLASKTFLPTRGENVSESCNCWQNWQFFIGYK